MSFPSWTLIQRSTESGDALSYGWHRPKPKSSINQNLPEISEIMLPEVCLAGLETRDCIIALPGAACSGTFRDHPLTRC